MIEPRPLPESALLQSYVEMGAYTDCYGTTIVGHYSLAAYVIAFYTTWLFKLERLLLKWIVKRPSTDADALDLVDGDTNTFAAWHVEERTDEQLLMCDFRKQTRSWFMSVPITEHGQAVTQLYFGSAVVPEQMLADGERRFSMAFKLLLGFHKLYSRALLALAAGRLRRS